MSPELSRNLKHWTPNENFVYSHERGTIPTDVLADKLGRSPSSIRKHGSDIKVNVADNDDTYNLKQIALIAGWSDDAMLKAIIEGRVKGIGNATFYDGRWHIEWDEESQIHILKSIQLLKVNVVESVDPEKSFRCHNCANFNSHQSGYCSERCYEEQTEVLPVLDSERKVFASKDFPTCLRPNFQADLFRVGWLKRKQILKDNKGELLKTKGFSPYQQLLEEAFLHYPGVVIPSNLLLRAIGEVEDSEFTRRRLAATIFRMRERARDRKVFYYVGRVGYGIGIRDLALYQAQLRLQRILWQHSGDFVAANYLSLNLFGDHKQSGVDSLVALIKDSYTAYKNSKYKLSQLSSDHLNPGTDVLYFRITDRN